MERRQIKILLLLLIMISGCDSEKLAAESKETEYCSKKLGCLNRDFFSIVNSRCPKSEARCRLSFEEAFTGLDKVYFVERLSARLDQCTTIPVSDVIKKSYTPLCQYVLFEKKGKIDSYLRGYCASEVNIRGAELGFDSRNVELVSLMDAKRTILVTSSVEKDVQEHEKKFYYITPPKEQLVKLGRKQDKCIGSP